MAGVNKVILLGHLGKDPEIRVLENGSKLARFTLATTESYKDRNTNERVDKTEWHNIVMWRGLADTAEKYLKKGSQIYLEGKIESRSYEQEGITKYFTEINAQTFTFVGARQNDNSSNASQGNTPAATPFTKPVESAAFKTPDALGQDDDLPF